VLAVALVATTDEKAALCHFPHVLDVVGQILKPRGYV
jgi:hypothetical protein